MGKTRAAGGRCQSSSPGESPSPPSWSSHHFASPGVSLQQESNSKLTTSCFSKQQLQSVITIFYPSVKAYGLYIEQLSRVTDQTDHILREEIVKFSFWFRHTDMLFEITLILSLYTFEVPKASFSV